MGNCNSSYQQSAPTSVVEKTTNIHAKIHEGSVLGLHSYVEDEAAGSKKLYILSCSDDKKVAKFAYNSESKRILDQVSYSGIHTKSVNKVISSKSFLWSVSRDLSVGQYDKNLAMINHYTDNVHTLNISSICVRSDETAMFTGSRDYHVRAFDVETKKMTRAFSQPRNIITCMQLAPEDNQKLLYQGSEDLQIRVWDTKSSQKHPVSTIPGYVYFPLCMSVHSSGYLLATGCKGFNGVGCEIKVWDVRSTSKPVSELKYHSQDVTDCKFSVDGDYLYSCSKDGTICAWNRDQFSGVDDIGGSGGNSQCNVPFGKYSQNNKIYSNLTVFDGDGNGDSSIGSDGKSIVINRFATGAYDGSLSFFDVKLQKEDNHHNNNGSSSSSSSGKSARASKCNDIMIEEVAYTAPHFMPEVESEIAATE